MRGVPFLLLAASALACSAPASEGPRIGVARLLSRAGAGPSSGNGAPAHDVAPAARPAVEPVAIHAMPPALTEAEIAFRLASDPQSLGSMSLGRPNRGALWNGAQMPESPLWQVVEPDRAWGTEETIASLMRAVARVEDEFPGSPKLYVGHVSARHGGYIRPHRSHQSGRDVDLGYYYLGGSGWYTRVNAGNLDRNRTWALVKALATDENIEAIFMDRSIQQLLRDHAQRAGEPSAWLDTIFEGTPRGPERLIRHEWGHLTHVHVRFKCPVAVDAGVRARRPIEAMERRLGPHRS